MLINLDDLVLIGPGSEWFWTAVSGLVLAVTFLAIYRQLRLQRDTAAIDQVTEFQEIWSSERMSRSKLACVEAIEAGVGPLDLPEKASSHVGDYWERIGYLTRTGHLDRHLAYEQWAALAQRWWHRFLPNTLAAREREHEPGIWDQWEWLVTFLAGEDRKAGIRRDFSPEAMAIDNAITVAQMREAIEIEESLRTIRVRIDPTPVPVVLAGSAARGAWDAATEQRRVSHE